MAPDVLASAFAAELARESLLDFSRLIDPTFIAARHIAFIAEQLERLERGEIRRLAICLPPRHGKTALVSQKFAAWYVGRHPSHQVILASYAAELADANSRAVRTMVSDDVYPFDVKVREDSRAANRWETGNGGVFVAAGTGGGLTGRGGHLIICDDLVKDREAAESDAIRASTAGWFSDVLRTRMMPDAKLLMVGTRWHEDDVLGRVLDEDGWVKIILPLIAEEDDPLGRAPGALLWPERFGPDDVPSVERGEISSRSFAALYQQSPVPAGGATFKLDWMQNRYERAPDRYAALRILVLDGAWGTKTTNDPSALALWATDRKNYYVIESITRRLQFPDLVRLVNECYREWKPHVVVAEAAASGIPMVQMLAEQGAVPIIGIPPKGDKLVRVSAITALFESGRVFLPKTAPWLDAWLDEHLRFPAGRHDDQVDCTSLALAWLYEKNMEVEADQRRAQQNLRFSIGR